MTYPTPDPSDRSPWAPNPEIATGGAAYGAALGYAVDIVFVIDTTGSMGPVIEQVKGGALILHDRLLTAMGAKNKYVSSLRLRVVAYRDYYDNPADALVQTPFFNLPQDRLAYDGFVRTLGAAGGGDEPESGLEALSVAMLSPWERGLDRRRHLVVVFTDASAHPLETSSRYQPEGYPTAIPRTMDALSDLWDDPAGTTMEFAAKRLLLFAPDVYPWSLISTSWDNVLHFPSQAGHGLNELQFSQIIDAVAGSV